MNVKILISVHKPCYIPKHSQYLPVHAGSSISQYKLPIQRDDDGEEISAKNGSFCELTALYWAWKNLKNVDVVGLCHYRRFFNFHNPKLWPVENRPDSDLKGFNLDIPRCVLEKINQGRIVVPAPWYSADTVCSQYCQSHYYHDYNALRDIVMKYEANNYKESFHVVIENGVKLCPFNMFIMRWCDFTEMCSWLFDLLGRYEKVTDISEYSVVQKRLYGYVAERLLNVWYHANGKALLTVPVTLFADGVGIGMSRFSYLKDASKCCLSRFVADWRSYKSW